MTIYQQLAKVTKEYRKAVETYNNSPSLVNHEARVIAWEKVKDVYEIMLSERKKK